MTLKQIRTTNIQSHRSVVIDLPEYGLVRIAGPNSAGKSILFKVLIGTLENKIAKPKYRGSLISRKCSFGEVTYVRHDDVELTIHLTIDASTTWVSLKKPGEEAVVRYLADKNYRDLVTEFGIHYNQERDFSINIGEGDKSILMYTTNGPTNYDAVNIALTDASAERALENLQATVKAAREFGEKSRNNSMIIESALSELKEYNILALSSKLSKLEGYFNILNSIYVPDLPEIKAVPKVRSLNIYNPKLPMIKIPRIVDFRSCIPQIPDVTELASEIKTLKSNVCPTCGRSFEC